MWRHEGCLVLVMAIFHLTLAVRGRQALARDEVERRSMIRHVAKVGGKRLLMFCLVDDHLHAGVRAAHGGIVGDSLRRVLKAHRPDLEFKRPHLEPVGTRAYLRYLVNYMLEQPARHGIGASSVLWTGSCFQDLVGARLLPGFDLTPLRSELPRLRLRDVFARLGLSRVPLRPADDEALSRAGPARLVDFAAGVFCVGPALEGRTEAVVAARSLAVGATRLVGLPTSAVAPFLLLASRTLRRLAARDLNPRALLALRLRLALEQRVAGSAS